MKEIERKFLVTTPPDNYKNWESKVISQGYLAVDEQGTEIRIRQKGNLFYETIKSGKGLSRLEIEINITEAQFKTLWPATKGKRIQKTRFTKRINNHIIELDVFKEPLSELIIAEIEFESETASQQFKPPEWFGKEITMDERYKNRNLAQ